MDDAVLDLAEIDGSQVGLVGGKGAGLGELTRIAGIRVPAGFCVTTEAFRRTLDDTPALVEHLERLAELGPDDGGAIGPLTAAVRADVERAPLPDDVRAAVTRSLDRLGGQRAYAVRSSATVEDQPTASFAGQHDTYLNVLGPAGVLECIGRCWASLFTQRAVAYRRRQGVDDRQVQMAVVVQLMIDPQAAGTLSTADPVTSDRTVVVVEAGLGLGEAVVSGRVATDRYHVRGDRITERSVATKVVAVRAAPHGGIRDVAVDPAERTRPALTDAQVLELAALGREVEAQAGQPQDIEWCLDDEGFHVVQSRPITSLFPVPATPDSEFHVYLSVGHAQMMTDAMKPLGLSFWQMTTPRPMAPAAGRLFVDVAPALRTTTGRAAMLDLWARTDPVTERALRALLERDDVLPVAPDPPSDGPVPAERPDPPETDPDVVTALIEQSEASVAALRRDIRVRSGPALLDFIRDDLAELRRILMDPWSHEVFMSAMDATWWLNDHLETWLGETNVADTLTRSVPHNVTSEMGLALLDVADVIRPHPEVVAFLEGVEEDEGFLDRLPRLDGGVDARDAIRAYLDRYGMRCVGEIDITRPRWSERPTILLPLILGNVRNAAPGAAARRFERGRREAWQKEQEVLAHLRTLDDGDAKAEETKQKIDRVRTFIGYREYPKYGMICRYFVYKQALLDEAARLVDAGVLVEAEDIFFLTFEELEDVVRTNRVDDGLIPDRKEDFRSYRALRPPRVSTSDGEVVTGGPDGVEASDRTLVGVPVSAGVVDGRARVLRDVGDAELGPGDILVTVCTDPSWTPAFVAVAGLVTEVGGMMTHGAVIAREYGLPGVVSVEGATRRIRDGQRIRVDGTRGTVDLLS